MELSWCIVAGRNCAVGGLAGPELDPVDVRGTARDRRLAVQRGAAVRARLEPPAAGCPARRRRRLPLYRQHETDRQQSRLAPRYW